MTSIVDQDLSHRGPSTTFGNASWMFARAAAAWRAFAQRQAKAAADQRFLERAMHDPRMLAELEAAMLRHESSHGRPLAAAAEIDRARRLQQVSPSPMALLFQRALTRPASERRI